MYVFIAFYSFIASHHTVKYTQNRSSYPFPKCPKNHHRNATDQAAAFGRPPKWPWGPHQGQRPWHGVSHPHDPGIKGVTTLLKATRKMETVEIRP